MHHNAVLIKNLSCTYPDGTQALRDITITIEAGEKVAIVGANGSGKSTLLLHLNGILEVQQGTIVVGKWLVEAKNLVKVRNFVGLVFQNPEDQLFMPTVGEDIAFGVINQGYRGEELQHRVAQGMTAMGLKASLYHRSVYNLSGGQKKRVAIAGVLAMNPEVLVMDEPSAQLDPRARRILIDLLANLPQTQIIATHDLDLALDICSRTVILNEGKVVYDGKTASIFRDGEFLESHGLELPLCYSKL